MHIINFAPKIVLIMNRIILFSLLLSLCSLPSLGLSIDETANEIFLNSPEFKAAQYSFDASSFEIKAQNNLPDPQIGGEYLVAPKGEPNRWGVELSWDLEWPGVYSARNKEAKRKIEVARQKIKNEALLKINEIKILLLDYIFCSKKLELMDDLNTNNDSIYKLSQVAASGGELTALDLNKVKLEYANIRIAKASLMDEKASIIKDLSVIYGNDCSSLLNSMTCEFPDLRIPSPEEISDYFRAAPSLEIARNEIELQKQRKKAVAMESLPNISIGYKHAFEDGSHFNGPLIGFSLPIFSSRGKHKAGNAALAEAEFNEEFLVSTVQAETDQTLKNLNLLITQLEEIEPILSDSNHNELLLKAYKNGLLSLIEYLTERNYYTSASIELLTLRHQAAVTLTRLQKYSPSSYISFP